MGDPPGKSGAVDGYDRVGLLLLDRRDRLPNLAKDDGGSRQHLCDPADGEFSKRRQAIEALFAHSLATDPGNPQAAANPLPQGGYQRSAERVARGLAGDNKDEGCRRRGFRHSARTPTTNNPASSAARITASRSSISVAPASTAIPRNPASAAIATVRAPMVGRSMRLSCCGLASLTSTPPAPSRLKPPQRLRRASVPSIASIPSTRPCWTTTACPTSSAPIARARAMPRLMSASASASG